MKCPICGADDLKVTRTRENESGFGVHRSRKCLSCGMTVYTNEAFSRILVNVVKADGRKEVYFRQKIIDSILSASSEQSKAPNFVDTIVNEVERKIFARRKRKISTSDIGEAVMEELAKYDPISCLTYAIRFRKMSSLDEVINEIKRIQTESEKS